LLYLSMSYFEHGLVFFGRQKALRSGRSASLISRRKAGSIVRAALERQFPVLKIIGTLLSSASLQIALAARASRRHYSARKMSKQISFIKQHSAVP
jgi:hypothetical protein